MVVDTLKKIKLSFRFVNVPYEYSITNIFKIIIKKLSFLLEFKFVQFLVCVFSFYFDKVNIYLLVLLITFLYTLNLLYNYFVILLKYSIA